MDMNKLSAILKEHAAWLRGREDGIQANLRRANLRRANLSGANLSGANLHGANLSGARYNVLAVLQAAWCVVSNELCTELMKWDATAHPNPKAFQVWAEGGDCPLNIAVISRAFSFSEERKLYEAGPPTMTLWKLWESLCQEKDIKI